LIALAVSGLALAATSEGPPGVGSDDNGSIRFAPDRLTRDLEIDVTIPAAARTYADAPSSDLIVTLDARSRLIAGSTDTLPLRLAFPGWSYGALPILVRPPGSEDGAGYLNAEGSFEVHPLAACPPSGDCRLAYLVRVTWAAPILDDHVDLRWSLQSFLIYAKAFGSPPPSGAAIDVSGRALP
jgi:hypothetical protein